MATANLKERIDKNHIKLSCGCWMWLKFIHPDGGGRIKVKGKMEIASRVSYKVYKGDIPKGLFVLHKCDNRSCINPEHLFIGTQQDNMTDMKNKGRSTYGEKHAQAKLTWDQVGVIRGLQGKLPSRKVAKLFDVDKTTILDIWNKVIWCPPSY